MADITGTDSTPPLTDQNQAVSPVETGDEVPPPAEGDAPVQTGEEEVFPEGAEVHKIPGELFRRLTAMGFSANGVKKSIVCGCINEDTCIQWLNMHVGQAELDTPLDPGVYCKVVEKRHYTPEELAVQVEAMKVKVAKRKLELAAEQRERDAVAEKNRVEGGRAMREAQEAREKKLRLEAYEDARKEKLRDAAAKERVQIQLAVDRKVRGGMDSEDARKEAIKEMEDKKAKIEEEKQKRLEEQRKEREENAKKRTEAANSGGEGGASSGGGWNIARVLGDYEEGGGHSQTAPLAPAAAPSAALVPELQFLIAPTQDNFTTLLLQMQEKMTGGSSNTDADKAASFQAAIKTLNTITGNISTQPLEMKFRQLKKSTTVFTHKIAPCPHAVELLLTLGFRSEQVVITEGQPPVDMLILRTVVMKRVLGVREALSIFTPN